MDIKQIAKNGQIVNAIKEYKELTEEELKALRQDNIDDYADFQVRYNKKGDLLGVTGNNFTEEKSKELEEDSIKPDILDTMNLRFGDKEQVDRVNKKIAHYNSK